jgi:hypothetical protein
LRSCDIEYRNYARGSHTDEINHAADVKGNIRLIDQFLFLDVNDTYSRISLDIARDQTKESAFANQSDRNLFSFSPYILWRLWHKSTLKTGYRFTNVWYSEKDGTRKSDHGAFAEMDYELTPKLTLNANYNYTHEIATASDYDRHDIYAGFHYEYADKSFISANGGNTWVNYVNGTKVSKPFWDVEVTNVIDSLTILLKTGSTFIEDPLGNITENTIYSAGVTKELKRGDVGITATYSTYDHGGVSKTKEEAILLGLTGHYDITDKLSGILAISGEHYKQSIVQSDFPYRFYANPSLLYTMNKEWSSSLTYLHISNFRNLNISSPEFGSQVNRLFLEVKMTF